MKIILSFSLSILILTVLFSSGFSDYQTFHRNIVIKADYISNDIIELPKPNFPNFILEDAISRRGSIRVFSDEAVSINKISTLLWSVYGVIDNNRTVESFDGRHVVKISVLMESGVYIYDPLDHILVKYRNGDWRWIGQYDTAYLKLGLFWDKTRCLNQDIAAAEIGMIGQNLYLMTNALNLGTVATAQQVEELKLLALPLEYEPMIIMPVGYPLNNYDYIFDPIETSLSYPVSHNINLSSALTEKQRTAFINGELKLYELSQILWAGYGYSYLYDNNYQKRHRTVPSSHSKYPLELLYGNQTGLYLYDPMDHSINVLSSDDIRKSVAGMVFQWIENADLIIIALNTEKANPSWAWYYESGAIWHNILLEAAALELSANIIINFNKTELKETLNLLNMEPLAIVQVGEKSGKDIEKPEISMNYPDPGHMYLFGKKILDSSTTIIIGNMNIVINVNDQSNRIVEFYLDNKLICENYVEPFNIGLPTRIIKRCNLKIVATDYFNNENKFLFDYIKII
jgi:nitroreductase